LATLVITFVIFQCWCWKCTCSLKAVVLNLYKHAEPLRSFPSFCRTLFFPIQQKVKMGYWNQMTFVEPLKRLRRTQFKNHRLKAFNERSRYSNVFALQVSTWRAPLCAKPRSYLWI